MSAQTIPPDASQSGLDSLALTRAAERLAAQDRHFRDLVENCSDLIHGSDLDGNILYANPAWHDALGYTRDDIAAGLSFFQIVHPDHVPASRERMRKLLAGERIPRFESLIVARDGRVIQVEGNLSHYTQAEGSAAFCAIYRDIAVRKSKESETLRDRDEAAAARRARSQFLANITDDVRAPLNGIVAMSSMLIATGLTDDQLRFARTIDTSAHALLARIDQILDFSKLDAGAATLDLTSFPIRPLVETVANLVSGPAGEKGLKLGWFVDRPVPERLTGDPERLRQVLILLMENAVKFTRSGEVRLDVRMEDGDPAAPVLRFTVIDTGIGMDQATRLRLFDPFPTADSSEPLVRTRTQLGLPIARQIVRLMGGDINVHSAPGDGSTFWFTAHFSPEESQAEPAPMPEPLPHVPEPLLAPPPERVLRFLIAEDNPVNQLVLSEQLDKLGHTSMTVSNGQDALAALKGSRWDALLLDCQMPLMDGFETVAALRREEAATSAPRTPVIAITAYSMEGERARCLRAGMDDFLTKPFHIQQLATIIARIPVREGPADVVDASLISEMSKSKAVNGQNLLERMSSLFVESAPRMLDQLDESLREDNFPAAVRAAHKLAGGCSYFGAEYLSSLCADFERLGRTGDQAATRMLAPRIRQEYARVELALKSAPNVANPLL